VSIPDPADPRSVAVSAGERSRASPPDSTDRLPATEWRPCRRRVPRRPSPPR